MEGTHLVQAEVRILATAAAQANQSVDEIVWAINPQNDTFRPHLNHIYEKLHARNRTEAAVKCLRR